ncbi:MAG: hypothetical protein KDA31_13990 [Phycisphaerales bacterium]|nr:hypothetical protein [Phycisphaerales bacterium]MCB9837617.1 hypothetical protein [Phycisphaera sp.]
MKNWRLLFVLPFVIPFLSSGQILYETGQLFPNDIGPGDRFGYSVSVSGKWGIVGAFRDDDAGMNSGSAYVFDMYNQQQLLKLTAADGTELDLFGCSVAANGNLGVVGAETGGSNGAETGFVCVFDLSSGAQVTKLVADDGEPYDQFGDSVALSDSYVAVGAVGDDTGSFLGAGSVYVYDTSLWSEVRKIVPDDVTSDFLFGHSVAIAGSMLLAGAPGDDVYGLNSGSAYLFDMDTGLQVMKFIPADGFQNDGFGLSVALSEEFVVIAAVEHDAAGADAGAVYVYDIFTGQELHKLTASDASSGDRFGSSIAVSGNLIVVGSIRDDDVGSSSGSAYIFDATTGDQLYKLIASDGSAGAWFGNAVGIDGGNIVVGAYDNAARDGGGAAYVYVVPTNPATCIADTNNDGVLSPADFSAWVAAFNSQAPECDQNGDGSCTPADFSAWVANYNAGC